MPRPTLDALPFLPPDECHEHGMFAAAWLADPANASASPRKRAAALEYQNAALTRWSASLVQTPPAPEDMPLSRAPLTCGGHAWVYREGDTVECHSDRCGNMPTCLPEAV